MNAIRAITVVSYVLITLEAILVTVMTDACWTLMDLLVMVIMMMMMMM